MGSKYCKINIDKVKDDFILEQENIIKVLVCNLRLEEIVSGMQGVLRNFKEDFGEVAKSYSDVIDITTEEICDFIEQKSLTRSEINRTFVELYELFERNIKLILEYVHYHKTEIIFHKDKKIDGDIFHKIIKDNSLVEKTTKKYIDDNVNKLIYSKNIEYVLNFICEKSKITKIDDRSKEVIGCFSILRNCIIHNKGFIDKNEFKKVKSIFAEGSKGDFTVDIQHETVLWALRLYKSAIVSICDQLKEKYEKVA